MAKKQIKHKGVILSDKEVIQILNEELEAMIIRLEQKEQKKEDDQKSLCIIESVLNNRW